MALKNYAEEIGHANPPFLYKTTNDYPLGTWVSVQRQAKHKNTLSAEHITQLESLDGWMWDALEEKWQQGFLALKNYAEEIGHANPPFLYKTTNDYPLGTWVSVQRQAKHKNTLSAEHITQLESLDGWMWDALEEKWQQGFDALITVM